MTEEEKTAVIDDRERKIQRERRYQSILISLATSALIGGGGWAASLLIELKSSNAVIRDHVATMDVQLSATYRTSEAKRDMQEVARRLDDVERMGGVHERSIERISNRVSRLENKFKSDR